MNRYNVVEVFEYTLAKRVFSGPHSYAEAEAIIKKLGHYCSGSYYWYLEIEPIAEVLNDRR